MKTDDMHGAPVDDPVEIESIWGPRLGKLTVGLLLTMVASAFEALAVATVMPETVDDLGGLHYYGWILASFTLANLVGIVLAGSEIDRIGMVRPFLIGIILFSLGLLIGGLAPSMPILIVGRVAQGFASGMLMSVTWTAVSKAYPSEARPRLMALTSSAWVIPGLVGPAVAGLVTEHIGWRWVFLGMIPFPLIAMALTVPSLRSVDVIAGGERDLRRFRDAFLLAVGAAVLLTAFGRTEWWALLGLGAIGLAVLLPSFGRLTPPGTLRARRGVAAAVVSVILLTIGFFGFEFFIPLALTDLRHQSPVMSGLPLTASALTWTAGAWIVDRTSTHYSRSMLVRVGLATVAIGILLTLAVCVTDAPVLLILPAWAVAGLGMGLAFSTLMLVVLDDAPEGSEGATISAGQLGNTLGIALGVGIGGSVVAVTSQDDIATVSGFVLLGIGTTIVLGLAIAIAGRLTTSRDRLAAESGNFV